MESFEDAIISFRCSGALLSVNINIYCEILHRTLMEAHWQQALKICRLAKSAILWATLAAVATRKNQLQISEEAYSAALQIDKVCYLQYMKVRTLFVLLLEYEMYGNELINICRNCCPPVPNKWPRTH